MSEITGILDNSTQQVVVLGDNQIILRGNVKVHGVLEAGLIKSTELITDYRYDKKFLTFVSPDNDTINGTGLLWADKVQNKQLVYLTEPNRFFLSENIDIPEDKALLIGGSVIISRDTLGFSITESNLKKVGTLSSLTVGGNVNLGDCVYFNPISQRLSIGIETGNAIFSVYDTISDVEIILEGNNEGRAKIGTYNSKGVDIVTGDQTRITVEANGHINLGVENRDNTITRAYGKLGVNVKNPKEQLEVAGNVKFQNKLFTTGNQPPQEGAYQKGDIVWNDDPMVNNYVGWICITSGAPGTWQPFGLIVG